jgi:hypothetical protein
VALGVGVGAALEDPVSVRVEEDPLDRVPVVRRVAVAVAVVRPGARVDLQRPASAIGDPVGEPQQRPIARRIDPQVVGVDPQGGDVRQQSWIGGRALGLTRGARRAMGGEQRGGAREHCEAAMEGSSRWAPSGSVVDLRRREGSAP